MSGPFLTARPPAIFLDRDGVLNEAILREGKPYAPMQAADFRLFPEALAQTKRLKELGFLLFVVTNQPELARGNQDVTELEAMHRTLRETLPLTDIFVCPHDDKDQCVCRKPKPGLLLQAVEKHGVDLAASFMVGDRWRDVEAGQRAGVRTVFIDYHYQERGPSQPADATVASLAAAVDWIVSQAGLLATTPDLQPADTTSTNITSTETISTKTTSTETKES